jgi:hypothetical protein
MHALHPPLEVLRECRCSEFISSTYFPKLYLAHVLRSSLTRTLLKREIGIWRFVQNLFTNIRITG